MTLKKRILLIDDEPDFTRLLKLSLEGTGAYEVREENQGSRGFSTALEFKPDLIVLDVIMPNVDGGMVISQLRADSRTERIPILFITAVMSKEEAISSENYLSGHPCLVKPVPVGEILSRIDKLFRGEMHRAG